MKHHCHAIGCEVETKPEMFMCYGHWAMVPNALQHAIKQTYRPGQCKDKRPSKAWIQNTLEARKVVRKRELVAQREEHLTEADYQTWMRL